MGSARNGVVTAVIAMLACTVGCTTTAVHVQPEVPLEQPRLAQPVPFVALIEQVVVTVDGLDDTAPVALGQRLAARIRGERVFANVFSPANTELAPAESARLKVHITTRTERHSVANGIRKVFILGSLLLLWPLLPYQYDLESTLVGTMAFPDGQTRTYRATTSLTRRTRIENANHQLWDLEARATSMNIDALVASLKVEPILISWPRTTDQP